MLQGDSTVVGTSKLRDLYERFEEELVRRQQKAKAARPRWEPPKTKLDEDPGGCWLLPGHRSWFTPTASAASPEPWAQFRVCLLGDHYVF